VERPSRKRLTLISALCVVAVVVSFGGSADAASATWKGEFTKDLVSFRHAAKGKASLIKSPPMFGEQFQDFNVYSGELLAESRQLGWLNPPSSCRAIQEETVKLLRRMSGHAYGLGDAKDLTTSEYELRSKQLLTLPARLTTAIEEARSC
jgi:hypothetical protein